MIFQVCLFIFILVSLFRHIKFFLLLGPHKEVLGPLSFSLGSLPPFPSCFFCSSETLPTFFTMPTMTCFYLIAWIPELLGNCIDNDTFQLSTNEGT